MQVPAEQVSPAPHAGVHGTSVVQVPPMQTSAPLQGLLQRPQCVVLAVVSTQVPPQQVSSPVQPGPEPHMQAMSTQTSSPMHAGVHGVGTHSPSAHISPAPHRMPHPPQFMASVRPSTQLPLQQMVPPVHEGPVPQAQLPAVQTLATSSQETSHIPQSSNEL